MVGATSFKGPPTLPLRLPASDFTIPAIIDTGSMANVMDLTLAKAKLNLPLTPCPELFRVQLISGPLDLQAWSTSLRCHVQCNRNPTNLIPFDVSFTVIDLRTPTLLGFPFMTNLDQWSFHKDERCFELVKNNIRAFVSLFPSQDDSSNSSQPSPATTGTSSVPTPAPSTSPSPATDLREQAQPRLAQVLREHEDIFTEPSGVPNRGDDLMHSIHLKPEFVGTSLSSHQHRLSPGDAVAAQEIINSYLGKGWITPSSSSWQSPAFLVKKSDTTEKRLVVDYRRLNERVVPLAAPVQRVDDLLDGLHSARWFSKLDLRNGFHQIKLNPSSAPFTAFSLLGQLYQFQVLPMGLANAPKEMIRVMTQVLRDHIREGRLKLYMDDILVHSPTLDQHLDVDLPRVLDTLSASGFKIKRSKCEFAVDSVTFLGHRISLGKMEPVPQQLAAIETFPEPTHTSQVRSFVGLASFWRKFIKNFAALARPLTKVQALDEKIVLNEEQSSSFRSLKKALLSAPVLALYDPNRETRIMTDASQFAIGAVLTQKQADGAFHPVYFRSRVLSPAESNLSATDRETLAIVDTLREWAVYTPLNGKLEVLTDHQPLQYLRSKAVLRPKEIQWLDVLSNTDIQFTYQPGANNAAADALSRIPLYLIDEATTPQLSSQDAAVKDKLIKAIQDNKGFAKHYALAKRAAGNPAFQVHNDLLFFVQLGHPPRLVVLDADWQKKILKEQHEERGHPGVTKLLLALAERYYWPKMRADVLKFVEECSPCATAKASARAANEILTAPPPAAPWDVIQMDFATGLSPDLSTGFDRVLVVVDELTSYTVLVPTKANDSAEMVINRLMAGAFQHYGMPKTIVSDRDTLLTSDQFTAFCANNNISQRLSPVGHHRSHGRAELAIRELRKQIRLNERDPAQKIWLQVVPKLQMNMNMLVNTASQYSPMQLFNGRVPRSVLDGLRAEYRDPAENMPVNSALSRAATDNSLTLRATANQRQSDQRPRPAHPITVGSTVLINTQLLRESDRNFAKMRQRFDFPLKVLALDAHGKATLDLPSHWRTANPIHVDFLKPYLVEQDQASAQVESSPQADHSPQLHREPEPQPQHAMPSSTFIPVPAEIRYHGMDEDVDNPDVDEYRPVPARRSRSRRSGPRRARRTSNTEPLISGPRQFAPRFSHLSDSDEGVA
jgi:hypothetical protein